MPADPKSVRLRSGAQPSPETHLELLLDAALEETFPASDPLALPLVADRPVVGVAATGSRDGGRGDRG